MRELCEEDAACFVAVGERQLKGFAEKVPVFRFEWRDRMPVAERLSACSRMVACLLKSTQVRSSRNPVGGEAQPGISTGIIGSRVAHEEPVQIVSGAAATGGCSRVWTWIGVVRPGWRGSGGGELGGGRTSARPA